MSKKHFIALADAYTKGLKVRGTLNVDNSQLSKK